MRTCRRAYFTGRLYSLARAAGTRAETGAETQPGRSNRIKARGLKMEFINFDSIKDKASFEPWTVRDKNLVLKGKFYHIPINQAKTPEQICTWLGQVASKSWANDRILAGLVRAFDSISGLRQ